MSLRCVYIAFRDTCFENLDVIASRFRPQLTDKVFEEKYFRICGVSRDFSSPLTYIFVYCVFIPFIFFFGSLPNIPQVSGFKDKGSRHMAK
jgi:hypothetical protein